MYRNRNSPQQAFTHRNHCKKQKTKNFWEDSKRRYTTPDDDAHMTILFIEKELAKKDTAMNDLNQYAVQ